MEDEASTDIETVEITESENDSEITPYPFSAELAKDERPIMLLLKRLIRNKQNTVMTNTQIIEILKEEFNIDIKKCHELEVDIYIKIIKKFLKDWPQWEELERISSKLSSAKDYDAVTKVLNHKYRHLKEYLGVMLEATKPLAKKAVEDLKPKKEETVDNSEVIMEVFCTRDELNHLFYRRPRTDQGNTIFNTSRIEPTRITLNALSFESILNSWAMKLSIKLPSLYFSRELTYNLKHTLVNKVLPSKKSAAILSEVLDTRLHLRGKKGKEHDKTALFQYFDRLLRLCNDERVAQVLTVIFHVIQTDMRDWPEKIIAPSSFKKNANPYKYVRYMYVENEENTDPKYDLQLEEIITPVYHYFFGKLGKLPEELPPVHDFLKVECMMCLFKCSGSGELMTEVQNHFSGHHQNEQDWQCPHCKRLFSMDFLSKNRCHHVC